MYTDKQNVWQTAALLRAHGIRKVVLCPGSRNIPLVHTFSTHPDFECYAVTDERSAGFMAIGLSLQANEAVAVCCTSGTALLNLHPAVCEAFYQQVPLVVLSADRPGAWIGQMDGQTLPQPGVFGHLVRKSVHLPEIQSAEDAWYANRLINEALLELYYRGKGPVHINIPISEPLFRFTTEQLPEVRKISRWQGGQVWSRLQEEWPRYRRCLVISGQLPPAEACACARWIPSDRVVWIAELLGNAPVASGVLRGADMALYTHSEEELQKLVPDLVITFGGHWVSKRVKQFIRTHRPRAHWHVAPDGQVVDLFGALTEVIEAEPSDFWKMAAGVAHRPESEYIQAWHQACACTTAPGREFAEVSAVQALLQALPGYSVLHLANSSVIRLAELCPLPEGVEVHGNRGTSGIEGSMSTAVGYAAASDKLNFLLIGDLSFFYDMNALWNSHLKANLRIAVFNNCGGSIFHSLPGLDMNAATSRFVTATHETSAEGWARSCGFRYLRAHDMASLQTVLKDFVAERSDMPVLLEIRTDAARDATALKAFYQQIK